MSTKELVAHTAKAIAWDQFFGLLDRIIFYPLIGFLALEYGWLFCFLITVPCYFVYSICIVSVNFISLHNKNIDLFGVHALRTVAVTTRPPILKFCRMWNQLHFHYHLVNEALMDHEFDIVWHIISRFTEKISKKILSWILSNKFMLYVVGTLVVLDPQSVFMFTTQKCKDEDEFVKKVFSKLFPMVCWHIFYWSGVIYGLVTGIKYLAWLA